MRDYYAILQVSPSAPDEVIKAAYRAMAKLYHPDTTQLDNAVAKRKMQEINEAFQVLSDKTKRAEYDLVYKRDRHQDVPPSGRETTEPKKERKNSVPEYSSEKVKDITNQPKRRSRLEEILHSFGRSIVADMQRNAQIRENAYLTGMEMYEAELVRSFKYARGAKRVGYCRALEERGLLQRNSENKLIPTELFKIYWS